MPAREDLAVRQSQWLRSRNSTEEGDPATEDDRVHLGDDLVDQPGREQGTR